MRFLLAFGFAVAAATPAMAQVELKAYANADGYIDVQALTCAQLANTFQEDADHLTAWYSGWYNGLAKKHMMKVDRAKDLEHEIIVYCKANRDIKVIQAIDVVFNAYRADRGIKLPNDRAVAMGRSAWSFAIPADLRACPVFSRKIFRFAIS